MTDDNACGKGYEKMSVLRLDPGETGVLLARAGAGKTAVLTHLALGYILDRQAVLHVCVDVTAEKVKLWYNELLRDIFSSEPQSKVAELQHSIEPLRFIMSFLNQTFSPEKVEMGIDNLKSQAGFSPALIIIDGLDFGRDRSLLEKIAQLGRSRKIPVWVSARSHRHIPDVNEKGIPYPIDEMDDLFSSIFVLHHEDSGVRLKALKEKGDYNPPRGDIILDPINFLPSK